MTVSAGSMLDDATARYVDEAQVPFEAMRAAAMQLAGYLLQRVLDPQARLGQAPRLDALGDLIGEAEGQLQDIVPRAMVASHHFRHLIAAMQGLRTAHAAALDHLTAARLTMLADACEGPLNDAICHLRHASNALPGFTLVDLADCCGAAHWRSSPD